RPETYVIKKKDGTLYYSFYASEFNGTVHFRGLEKGARYSVSDLWDGSDLGTADSSKDSLSIEFKQFRLLKLNRLTK
ncbi:MAG: hypothetical protein QMB59_06945, partial [Bacteroidales bacterium]